MKVITTVLLFSLSITGCQCFTGIVSKSFVVATGTTSAGIVANNNGNSYMTTPTTTKSLTSTQSSSTQLNAFFENFFNNKKQSIVIEPDIPKFDPVTIEPDFRIAGVFLILGILLDTIPYIQLSIGPLVTALGILFLIQTVRLRFVFDENNCLELQSTIRDDKSTGDNVIVGGANKWDCSTIVNYDFFPKGWIDSSPTGPILVYFKETQTPVDTWNQGPGKQANDPIKIANGEAIAGQVHFFPAICNAKQIREEFDKRGCRKL